MIDILYDLQDVGTKWNFDNLVIVTNSVAEYERVFELVLNRFRNKVITSVNKCNHFGSEIKYSNKKW